MIFTLKIIRKLFGVVFKIVKLPIKLGSMLAGSQVTSVGSAAEESVEVASTETTNSETAEETAPVGSPDKSPQEAQKYLTWLQYGMFGWGALQAILFVIIITSLGMISLQGQSGILPLVGVIGGIGVLLPIAIGVGLRRESKIAWYAAIGYVVLNALSIFASPPSAIVQLPLAIGFGYLALNSKPAVESTINEPANDEKTTSSDAGEADKPESDSQQASSSDVSKKTTEQEEDSEQSSVESAQKSEMSDKESAATSGEGSTNKQAKLQLEEYESRLSDEDATERQEVCRELATAIDAEEVPTDAAVDQLTAILENDDDTAVRKAACEALGAADTPTATDVLETYRLDSDREISQTASQVLRNKAD